MYINGQAHGTIHPYRITRDDLKVQIAVNFHPNPQNVLIIGIGNGHTLYAERYKEIKNIDVVEISHELIDVIYNTPEAQLVKDALESQKVNLITTDGRMYLNQTSKKYDLVMTSPIWPFNNYGSYLYSSEMFELVKSRLEDDGIFSVIYTAYTPSISAVQLSTFYSQFPFMITDDANFLHGSKTEFKVDKQRIAESYEMNKNWLTSEIPESKWSKKRKFNIKEPGHF